MESPGTMKEYHRQIRESLDNEFLRETLDAFAVAYRINRANIFADLNAKELIREIADAKDESIGRMDWLYDQFRREAEKRGVSVHRAATAADANEIICRIAKENNCKRIIKSKSMTGEEIHINHALEAAGCSVVETDLGEWIIQLRHESPTHMVMPAIHLSRRQVAELFSRETEQQQDSDIAGLVRVARRELRARFAQADMGISGANFALADTGTVAICTNEGNGRLTTTLPRVHVALCGLDKLVPSIHEAMRVIKVLPRNATAQIITSYVTWITGATDCAANADKKKIMHVVFLDNGRSALANDPLCRSALRCVRCGACANVCPVYRLVGGHKMGYIYIGAIGLILTYFFHGRDKARQLIHNCINCEACKDICAAGIDLPGIIQEIRARIIEEEGSPVESALLAKVLADRKLFHSLLRMGKWAQRPITGGTPYIRHLPSVFMKRQGFRALPAIARRAFRDRWNDLKKTLPAQGRFRIGLFAGCAQDFVYPEHLEAAVKVFTTKDCVVDFPFEQSCCGLPLRMMGERKTAERLALQNVRAFAATPCDCIITLCASCASHIKSSYPHILAEHKNLRFEVEQFVSRIKDFSSFVVDVLKIRPEDIRKSPEKVCYHSPCHLGRGLCVTEQPRRLMAAMAEYCPSPEEDSCCGFGGSYSLKFPEISDRILSKKLDRLEAAGAEILLTECPGCVLQLRGGEERRGNKLRVAHMAEFLAETLRNR